MATPTTEIGLKRVRFSLDDDKESARSPDDFYQGQWDFLKYLLTLREEFNITTVVESLVQKGVISADAGTDVMRQGNARAQIELCVQEVMKGGSPAYAALCETLQEHGYSNIVDALKREDNMHAFVPELSDMQGFGPREKQTHWSQSASLVNPDEMAVQGKKMSLGALARDTKASQKEFSVIVERQHELEKQLVQVMKSLDTAKDMLIRERQEKLGLREQLKGRDEELVGMQRKYLELQKAMANLRDTNNKYHEKVTKLQIENETLRRGMKDRDEIEGELRERNSELVRLKEVLNRQEQQMKTQEEQIVQKLDMIEKVVTEHRGLIDGQDKLTKRMSQQQTDIVRLSEEKLEAQNQMAAQQRQLNFQHAQIVMLQEQMQRMEAHISQGATGGTLRPESLPPVNTHPTTPVGDSRGGRYIASLSKGMNLRPFNAQGKLENSKNSFWRSDPSSKKSK
ncbi:trichohyalin-like [Ruditapes philippinarum]|uniref:trichohyalin-like n=1 Tax=Ruditapes philippinarum TaxID=129788 RepID=UPI00295B9093|nr:trichohyalin-like [Ruditapes philippinarum]